MGARNLAKELERLNPSISFKVDVMMIPEIIIASCKNCEELELPEEYYYCQKGIKTYIRSKTSSNHSYGLMTKEQFAMI